LIPAFDALRQPSLRMIAVALLLVGAHNASLYPYQSLIAIDRIGLSNLGLALVLVLATSVAVSASVLLGILGDQRGHRQRIALVTAAAGTAGLALMLLAPGRVSFVISFGVLIPLASSLYGQLFALARLAAPRDPALRDTAFSTIRAGMSLSFLVTLGFWTWGFAAGAEVMAVLFSAGAASLGLTLLVWRRWPQDGATAWADLPSGLNLRQSFGEILRPAVLIRMGLIGAMLAPGMLYMVLISLISLIFAASPVRDNSDVALYVALVAGWEVPCILILPRLMRGMRRSSLIALAGMCYTCHVLLLPVLSDSPLVWVMTLFAGAGGAALLVLPIAYYQDLLAERPGAAASLMALQRLVSDGTGALIFVIGTWFGGFGLTALLGTLLAVLASVTLWVIDRRS
jgi:SET family sugar efflux transporter-like MFS transporter